MLHTINKNIEIIGNYINSTTKVKCRCKIDGYEWEATPNKLIQRRGCPKCAKKEPYTKETFLLRLREINPDIDIVSEFKNGDTQVRCRCKIDNYEWESKPYTLIRGFGCAKCGGKLQKTNEDFVKELSQVTNKIELLTHYVNSDTKIKCRCRIDGYEWSTQPSHLLNGHGCPKCSGVILKSHEDFVQELSYIQPNIIVLGAYDGNKKKILCQCSVCGHQWKGSPNALLRGRSGCASCNESYGEAIISSYLKSNQIPYVLQKRFDDCKDKFSLPFDFYLPDLNMCIEYDGEQHFRPVNFGGCSKETAQNSFKKIQYHDNIKSQYCLDNNISLIRIDYTQFNKIHNKLDEYLL